FVKLSVDVRRCVYEREKLVHYGEHLAVEFFMPYPGQLMAASNNDVLEALTKQHTPEMSQTPQEVLEAAKSRAAALVPNYEPFLERWGDLMRRVDDDDALRRQLLGEWQSSWSAG
ncbi:MAG: hypothetical protein AAF125_03110, partial [Chloroflexota bacterium]